MELNEILKVAIKGGASDIHLKSGLPPMFRVDGALVPLKNGERIMPDELQQMISRAFANLNWVPRFVNNLLQAKWACAGRELGRFLINSVAGIGGLWDIAKVEFNIEPSKADFGQTLGKWGTPPGPYLVLPFLPPLTFRDGRLIDQSWIGPDELCSVYTR